MNRNDAICSERRKQQEILAGLDKQYEMARVACYGARGSGFGFASGLLKSKYP
jgi:hypothetical protein